PLVHSALLQLRAAEDQAGAARTGRPGLVVGWRGGDSNSRPRAYESPAPPLPLAARLARPRATARPGVATARAARRPALAAVSRRVHLDIRLLDVDARTLVRRLYVHGGAAVAPGGSAAEVPSAPEHGEEQDSADDEQRQDDRQGCSCAAAIVRHNHRGAGRR